MKIKLDIDHSEKSALVRIEKNDNKLLIEIFPEKDEVFFTSWCGKMCLTNGTGSLRDTEADINTIIQGWN